jgi:hypothetical protein
MLNKYRKKEAPSWQQKLVLLLGSLLGATILLFVVWAIVLVIDSARVDDCLDRGGSYDYERGECDFQVNHDAPEE